MAKLIGNLITGDHVVPKPAMPWQRKLAIGLILLFTVSFGGFLIWKFINYREESRVTQFFQQLASGDYQQAFASWEVSGSYTFKDFMDDFGKDGYYTKGMHTARVVTSHGQGRGVIVCVLLDNSDKPLPIRVEKDSTKLSYSPFDNKCQ